MQEDPEATQLPSELQRLSILIEDVPETLASGNTDIHEAALSAAKFVFDLALQSESKSRPHIVELLSSLSPSKAPQTRSQTLANGKRKRSPSPPPPPPVISFGDTPLTSLFIDGMDEGQIWEQLDLRAKNVCKMLEHALQGGPEDEDEDDPDESDEDDAEGKRFRKALKTLENEEMAVGDFEDKDDVWMDEEDFDHDSEELDEDGEGAEDETVDDMEFEEAVTGLRESSSDDNDDDEDLEAPAKKGKVRFHEEVRVKRIKAKGRNLPIFTKAHLRKIWGKQDGELDGSTPEEEEEEEEDYLYENDDLMDGIDHSSEGSNASNSESDSDGSGDDSGNTAERFGLFDDDDDEREVGNLSTHEKRMAALREEISRLEAENVGEKDWMLMGEANARSRPQNSLLEEDLEFERVMKVVPIITEENVQALEERIKARILEGRYDDVIRRRPIDDKPFLPSRLFELKDTKSTQSLAQIYEADYVAAQTGAVAGEDRDGRLKKEHEELTQLWENICGKLDALCNAHFVPKQPKATISTVSNVPAVSLESALPTAKSVSTLLAPEEIFSTTPSDLRARSELTPTEKRASRNRERKHKKKNRDLLDKGIDKYAKMKGIRGVKKQKEEALKSVVKSGKGVTVLGKKKVSSKRDRKALPVRNTVTQS